MIELVSSGSMLQDGVGVECRVLAFTSSFEIRGSRSRASSFNLWLLEAFCCRQHEQLVTAIEKRKMDLADLSYKALLGCNEP